MASRIMPLMQEISTQNLIAGVHFERGLVVEACFEKIVKRFNNAGIRVSGYLQREMLLAGDSCSHTYLENIASGVRTRISQDLGSGAKACKLDPHKLLELSTQLCTDLDANAGLLIINRFGRGESEGHGFRPAIEKAFELGRHAERRAVDYIHDPVTLAAKLTQIFASKPGLSRDGAGSEPRSEPGLSRVPSGVSQFAECEAIGIPPLL